jgi:hypothetical protein
MSKGLKKPKADFLLTIYSNDFLPKTCFKFYRKFCDYGTSKKSSYEDHLTNRKHQKSILVIENLPKSDGVINYFLFKLRVYLNNLLNCLLVS